MNLKYFAEGADEAAGSVTGRTADIGSVKGGTGAVKGTSKAGNDILSNKSLTNRTGKVDNYVSEVKGYDAALKDFNSLQPNNVRTYSNGTIVGDLPDGRTINLHPSTSLNGTPTVEIRDPSIGRSIKIRY